MLLPSSHDDIFHQDKEKEVDIVVESGGTLVIFFQPLDVNTLSAILAFSYFCLRRVPDINVD